MSVGILDSLYHDRLIADLDRFAKMAGVPKKYITSSLDELEIDEQFKEWVTSYHQIQEDYAGTVFIGCDYAEIEQAFMGLVGVLTRNHVYASFMTLAEIEQVLKSGEDIDDAQVLFIPDFQISSYKCPPDWIKQKIMGFITGRTKRGLYTVLHAEQGSEIEHYFGNPLAGHLNNHFQRVEG